MVVSEAGMKQKEKWERCERMEEVGLDCPS
jgi:hypothetical protein